MKSIGTIEDSYCIHKIRPEEKVSAFDCNDADLNDFLQNIAHVYQKALLAVTYVLAPKENPDKICGFFSLANDNVALTNFSKQTQFKRFRRKRGFHNRKLLKSYPAIKLCRIGIDSSVKNHGLGTMILDYLKTNLISDSRSGCRFVIVDAYIDAIPFYEKNGFLPLNDDDKDAEKTRLLFYDLGEVI